MKHRIALRLLAFFASALLLFALAAGLLFGSLFQKVVLDSKKAEMLDRAAALSRTLSSQMEGQGGRGMGSQGGYGAAVRILTQSSEDTWVLDENLQVLSSGRMMGRTLEYAALPPDAEFLVREAFAGRQAFSEGFSALMGYPSLTLGVPIYRGDTVAGALLLHGAVSGISAAAAQGQRVLVYAVAAALVLAIVLSVILSFSFTRPIKRMQVVAGQLAAGDYTVRTGLTGKDEIAGLAQSIDSLSQRLQEARDARDMQEQQRRTFLANVSHELRTPVTVLRGSLEALRDGVVSAPGQVQEYHGQMLKEVEGLQRLVNDLLELARLQNADFKIEAAPVLLEEVVQDALRGAGQLARAKGIGIDAELDGASYPLDGDYARLKQMLMVALDNAVKFSREGSTIRLRLGSTGIAVQDWGQGIPKKELAEIFERFHRSLSGENRNGSGLGLAIAREIALRHGMGIQIDSVAGEGTTVRFTLPNQKD